MSIRRTARERAVLIVGLGLMLVLGIVGIVLTANGDDRGVAIVFAAAVVLVITGFMDQQAQRRVHRKH